jgi:hypothetical protein
MEASPGSVNRVPGSVRGPEARPGSRKVETGFSVKIMLK